MNYVYQYDIAAIIIAIGILVSLFRAKNIHTRVVNSYRVMLILIILCSMADLASIFMLRYPGILPLPFYWGVNIAYHVFFMGIALIFYYSIYFATEENRKPQNWSIMLFSIPYLLALFYLFSTPVTHFIFYFDEDGVYCRGRFFNILYMSAAFYVAACLYRSIRKRSQFTPFQLFTVYFYMSCSVAAIVIQFFFPELMVMNLTLAVSAMVVYLSLENPSDYEEKEMKVFNRRAFIELMNQKLDSNRPLTLVGLQYTDLKQIEKIVGTENCRKILTQLGLDFMKITDKRNIFRISRSRFVIVLDENPRKKQQQINSIINLGVSPFHCSDLTLKINVKALLICCPEDASKIDDVIELLEQPFTQVLSENDKSIRRSDSEILDKRYRDMKILDKIKEAIDSDSFEVYYQPIYSIKEKRVTGAEALIRMRDSDNNFVNPGEFIPLTEKSGLISNIGTFVLEEICKFLSEKRLWEKGLEYINVNLSVIQCMQESFHNRLIELLDKYKLDHKLVNLEITESSVAVAKDVLQVNMTSLKSQGMNFVLDDYGSDYSTTGSLIKYSFDAVKIGKKLVWSAMKEDKAYTVLEETVSMIKDMGFTVIASGVESQEQANLLEYLGCDYLQGYYYSIPLNKNRFAEFFK